MLIEMRLEEKFIAFIDVLGFSKMVEAQESSANRDFSRLFSIIELLSSTDNLELIKIRGSTICPYSRHISKDLNFVTTQISDCAVISAEISPAGVINIVKHCWLVASKLLNEGVLCRGVITRGNICHTPSQFFGTGYMRAYNSEKSVKFLQANEHEEGTPFIELQQPVVDYITNETDPCVREMVGRMSRSDGAYTAIYPFDAMGNAPFAEVKVGFDPHQWKRITQDATKRPRKLLQLLDEQEARAEDEKTKSKIRHYKNGLKEVIARLKRKEDDLDHMIATGCIPYGTSWGD